MGRWGHTISDVEIHSKICQISKIEITVSENAGLIDDEVKHIFKLLPNFH